MNTGWELGWGKRAGEKDLVDTGGGGPGGKAPGGRRRGGGGVEPPRPLLYIGTYSKNV